MADLLSEAFFYHPENLHGLPDEAERRQKLKYPFRTIAAMGVTYGMVYAPSPALEGVVVVLPYDKYRSISVKFMRQGLRQGMFKLGWRAMRRYSVFGKVLFPAHKQHAPGPHWYIFSIGVQPARQGQGLGSQLMQHVIDQADPLGIPIYLETELERNVRFYRALGFDILGKRLVPGTQVTFWFLRRDPPSKTL